MGGIRWRVTAAAFAVYLAWCAGQVAVTRYCFKQFDAFNRAEYVRITAFTARRVAETGHPASYVPSPPVSTPAETWLRGGFAGIVAMTLVLAVAVGLVLGGRRWWSLAVAGLPAATVVGKFQDGSSIGVFWTDFMSHTEAWAATGVIVDTVAVAVIVALLVVALPREAAAVTAPTALVRGAVPAILLYGWWLVQKSVGADSSTKVWVAQAIVWVFVLALLVSSAVPAVPKVLLALVVAPYLSATMLYDLVYVPGFNLDTTQFVHHMLVAAGVALYVVGVPALFARLRPIAEPGEEGVLSPS